MAGIGFPELLIVAVLACGFSLFVGLYVALFGGGRIRAALVRFSEARVYRELSPPVPLTEIRRVRTSRIPFPKALLVVGALGSVHFTWWTRMINADSSGGSVISVSTSTSPYQLQEALQILVFVLNAVGLFCVFAALRLHFRPAHDRHRKYEFLLIGACCLGFWTLEDFLDGLAGNTGLRNLTDHTLFVECVLLLLNPATALLALTWLRVPNHAAKPRTPLDRRALRHLRLLRRLAIPAAWMFTLHPFVLIYLWSRYFVIDVFSREPILYFRSFRYAAGATAFGRIVSKTARWYGVPAAVVHEAQPASVLQRFTSIADQATTSVLPATAWQEWVLARLDTASAAIFDLSLSSESLEWELHAAQARLGTDRIVVLRAKGTAPAFPPDVRSIEYDVNDKKSVQRARRRLRAWFEEHWN